MQEKVDIREDSVAVVNIEDILSRLRRHGLFIALRHFEQAESAYHNEQWEAANSQIRTFLEALFNSVAVILLKSHLTGGAARKKLADEGIISPRESKFIQSFMEIAGEFGSHAGLGNSDIATIHRLGGLSVALIGISLIPDVVRVEEVFTTQLYAPNGGSLPRDCDITTICPSCSQVQNLKEAEIYRDGEETVYRCKNGCQSIVVVGLPGQSPWPGRGYRLGKHVIRNAKDLVFRVTNNGPGIVIPASPAALMKAPHSK